MFACETSAHDGAIPHTRFVIMKRLLLASVATAAIIASSTIFSASAHAGLDAAGILSTYNLVTKGNVTTTSDIEGSAAIGGNLNGSTIFNNVSRLPANLRLDVYGTVQGNLNIDNGGTVHYGAKTGTINLNAGSTASQGNFSQPLNVLTATLDQLVANIHAMTNTPSSTITVSGGKTIFNSTSTSGTAVFSLSGAQLQADLSSSSNGFQFSGASAYLINVSGNFTEPTGANWNAVASNVIFNFFNADQVTVGNWESAILAPNAAVHIASGNIEGFLYANSFTGGGELHNDPFTASIAEPASVALLAAGMAGIGLTICRGKKANRYPQGIRI